VRRKLSTPVITTDSTPPPNYRFGSDGTLRCEAGSPEMPTLCEWHSEHHWCDACEGHYGVIHDLFGCHTMQRVQGIILPGSSRPRPDGQCACRWCQTWLKHGYEFAAELFPRFSRNAPPKDDTDHNH